MVYCILSVPTETTCVYDEHKYCLPSPKKMKAEYDKVKEENVQLKKRVKQMRQLRTRDKRRIVELQTVVAGLRKRLCSSVSDILNSESVVGLLKELLELQAIGKVSQYSQQMRKFALTLHFYSAKAYSYLRKFVKLPHPRTLRQWAMSVGGHPGFTEESFAKIASEVEGSTNIIFAALMFDEMAIKKDLVWDGEKVTGYVDLGEGGIATDDSEAAKEALVFMVTALNRNWKIPVGYCLVHSLSATVKLNLVQQYLRKLEETGVVIVAVVCDGTATNRSLMSKLGISCDDQAAQCWFPHPANSDRQVFCMFDTAHMLKLARNLLAEKHCLIDGTISGSENKIRWEYFVQLVKLHEREGLHAANKLRRQHIEYHTQKMKVALAAQTLSNSVANALLFCKDLGIKEFYGCEATAKYIKMLDGAFDLLNSCHTMGKGTKAPIFRGNRDSVCARIDDYIYYFKNLKLSDGTTVLLSNRKMPLYGIVLNLMSIRKIAELYVWTENAELHYILTRRTSQDNLELFFASIRSRGGNRNNPNAVQFRSAYRKCLVAQIEGSQKGNCLESNTGINILSPGTASSLPFANVNSTELVDHDYVADYTSLSMYSESVIEYIAGSIVRQVTKKISCTDCLDVLFASTASKAGLIAVKDVKNSLINPANDVVKLFNMAEKVFRRNEDIMLKCHKNVLLKFQTEVLQLLRGSLFKDNEHLFTATEFGEETHYVKLIKLLLKHYFMCRINHLCKVKSAEQRGKVVRQLYTKLILFKGQ